MHVKPVLWQRRWERSAARPSRGVSPEATQIQRWRGASAVRASLAVAALFAVTLVSAATAGAQSSSLIPYLDTGWKYKVVPYNDWPGFESPGFDDSSFALGDAGFGTEDFSFGCALYHPPDLKTPWAPSTDILLRKTFTVPPGAGPVRVAVAIDDQVQVFVNGHDISDGFRSGSGCAMQNQVAF